MSTFSDLILSVSVVLTLKEDRNFVFLAFTNTQSFQEGFNDWQLNYLYHQFFLKKIIKRASRVLTISLLGNLISATVSHTYPHPGQKVTVPNTTLHKNEAANHKQVASFI